MLYLAEHKDYFFRILYVAIISFMFKIFLSVIFLLFSINYELFLRMLFLAAIIFELVAGHFCVEDLIKLNCESDIVKMKSLFSLFHQTRNDDFLKLDWYLSLTHNFSRFDFSQMKGGYLDPF